MKLKSHLLHIVPNREVLPNHQNLKLCAMQNVPVTPALTFAGLKDNGPAKNIDIDIFIEILINTQF